MPNYNDASRQQFFSQDVKQKAKYASQDIFSWLFKMLLELIKAVASFIGDMFKQFLGK